MNSFDSLLRPWNAPEVTGDIPHGDMPGDQIAITPDHINKAQVIFPELKGRLYAALTSNPKGRAVIAVCGGSGVGKSEIASILSFYLNSLGVGSYTLSGDNYPHRIPRQNDAERLRVFRMGGLRGLVCSGWYKASMRAVLAALWQEGRDADPTLAAQYPWLAAYQKAGRAALSLYLGSEREINFQEVSELVSRFKLGADSLFLKRMGRTEDALWYDEVDMRGTAVLIIEWTHGNSDGYCGVDIPVFLNSTPAETLSHRRARGRDGATDSPFTTLVLEIEQEMLSRQAVKAGLILSKAGKLLTYADYRQLMSDQ